MHIKHMLCRLGVVIVGVVGLSQAGCSTNPATGERSFTMMSWDQEIALAAQAGPEFTAEYGGETPDAQVQGYVDELGAKLTEAALSQAHAEVPDLAWDYTLLDSAVLNAFALPGGKVFVSRGLADKLENEAELAGVMGHEIGHVMARHGNQRMSKQNLFNIGLQAGAVAVGSADQSGKFSKYGQLAIPALSVGGNVVLLSYGRDEEMEADALGMQYMSACGWDPAAQRAVMQILERESQGSSPPEWLSTHPTSATRIQRIDDLLRNQYSDSRGNPGYVLNAKQYEQRMLSRLAKLPAPQQSTDASASPALRLEDSTTWCAICAAEARRDAQLASR
ncbi:MAG: M48 family metallopeptidase [Phycisphaerales bacterium]|nr:M48 family metallopeptidase [Phycisphaerales bacterium]